MPKPEPIEEKKGFPKSEDPLPDFERPPVVEVAISIQFEPLEGLTVPKLGMLWLEYKEEFPITQDQAPLDAAFEFFGIDHGPRVGLRFGTIPPLRRVWFLNKEETELLQIQEDRFVRNWRKKTDEDKYPHYENIRNPFIKNYRTFESFLARENINTPRINQCEITYVNPIIADENWSKHSELSTILYSFKAGYSDGFLPEPENINLSQRFIIPDADGKPMGRLHINVDPFQDLEKGKVAYLLKMIARGKPAETDFDSAMEFIDIGREWIVRGFKSATTNKMHDQWRIINEDK